MIAKGTSWARWALALSVIAMLISGQPAPVAAAPLAINMPDGFVFEPVVDGLKLPTGFAFAPDGRIFIIEKAGRVRVFADGKLQDEDFIDLTNEVNSTNERGLVGVAVHPKFPAVPYVYLAYVYEPPEAKGLPDTGARVSRVLRLAADPKNLNKHVPGSGEIILGKNSTFANIGNPAVGDRKPYSCLDSGGGFIQDCLPDEGTSHGVDMLLFAPDGSLFVSTGDGINFNSAVNVRAQNPDSPVGKILRINPLSGEGYASNPFYDGNPNSNRSKVYALGLRNPFRFTLHPRTGQLVIADVGNSDWEEINIGGAGANFGWPCLEGHEVKVDDNGCQAVVADDSGVTHAVYSYPHDKGFGSVIGGDFYLGRSYPPAYRGAYFFGDFNVGMMLVMTFNGDGSAQVSDFAGAVPGPVQITRGPDGDIYVMTILGALFRIRYVGAAASSGATSLAPSGAIGAATTGSSSTASAAAASSTGKILREWWTGVPGKTVADLTKNAKFQGKPSGSEFLTSLEGPLSFDNDFGDRIRGYIHPPTDGEYTFWIAADDSGELWLSTDDDPANKQLIAYAPDWTQYHQFDKYPSQQSGLVKLAAGKSYYVEVLHKDADLKDNIAVAWQPPGGERAIIDGKYLSPYAP